MLRCGSRKTSRGVGLNNSVSCVAGLLQRRKNAHMAVVFFHVDRKPSLVLVDAYKAVRST